jgi:hypothetical protein
MKSEQVDLASCLKMKGRTRQFEVEKAARHYVPWRGVLAQSAEALMNVSAGSCVVARRACRAVGRFRGNGSRRNEHLYLENYSWWVFKSLRF